MILYIITNPAHYYPGTGTHDWKSVHKTLEGARKAWTAALKACDTYEDVVVISLDTETLEYGEIGE